MSRENKEIATVKEALDAGASLDINIEVDSYEEAKNIIQSHADRLERTWQKAGYDGTKWLEVVIHDEDNIDVAVYYE